MKDRKSNKIRTRQQLRIVFSERALQKNTKTKMKPKTKTKTKTNTNSKTETKTKTKKWKRT